MSFLKTVKAYFIDLVAALDPEAHRQREIDAFLNEATSHADLEWRFRVLDQKSRRPSHHYCQH
jgi:hypothetical protein